MSEAKLRRRILDDLGGSSDPLRGVEASCRQGAATKGYPAVARGAATLAARMDRRPKLDCYFRRGHLVGLVVTLAMGTLSVRADDPPTLVPLSNESGAPLPSTASDAADSSQAERPTPRAQRRRARRTVRRTKRVRRVYVSKAYARTRDGWHRAASPRATKGWVALDPMPLVLARAGSRERVSLTPMTGGAFDPSAIELARTAFADRRSGQARDVHPRLIELLYRAVRHFEVPYARIVSGYRPARASSRHTQGRALDFVLPGVADRTLAAFLRQQGFVGVGLYPVSGFVHLDVRARSYFWIDRSGPGQAERGRAIMRPQAARADARARTRGELSVPDDGPEETEIGEAPAIDAGSVSDSDPPAPPPS